jgi:NAD(P)-dependent dehydrogenase (short-subunit alcohol dehydrogenase family)
MLIFVIRTKFEAGDGARRAILAHLSANTADYNEILRRKTMPEQVALIVGAGPGLSAALARRCAADGMRVGLVARNTEKLDGLVAEIDARAFACDVTNTANVKHLFTRVENELGVPDLVVYNPSARAKGSIVDLDPQEVEKALMVTCFGGFLVAQQAVKLMLQRGQGTMLFTGASASVKGYANSAPFAMGKFGLRGLAQSMARELAPKGIHVAHFIIDGSIAAPSTPGVDPSAPDDKLNPDVIAANYLAIHHQHRSAWTWEIELRPWLEHF